MNRRNDSSHNYLASTRFCFISKCTIFGLVLLGPVLAVFPQTPYVLREILEFQNGSVSDRKLVDDFLKPFFIVGSTDPVEYDRTVKDLVSLSSPPKLAVTGAMAILQRYTTSSKSTLDAAATSLETNPSPNPGMADQGDREGKTDEPLSLNIEKVSAQVIANLAKDIADRAVATSIEYALRKSEVAKSENTHLRRLFPELRFQIDEMVAGRAGVLGFMRSSGNAAIADLFSLARTLLSVADEASLKELKDNFESRLCSEEFDAVYLGLSFVVAFQEGRQVPVVISEVRNRFIRRLVAANRLGSEIAGLRYNIEILSQISLSLQKNKSEYMDIGTVRKELEDDPLRTVYLSLLSRRVSKELNAARLIDPELLGDRVDSFVSGVEMLREALKDFRKATDTAGQSQNGSKLNAEIDTSRLISAMRQLLDVSAGESASALEYKVEAAGTSAHRTRWQASLDFLRVLGYLDTGSYGQAAMLLVTKTRQLSPSIFAKSDEIVTMVNLAASLMEAKSLSDLGAILDPSATNATYVTNLIKKFTVSLNGAVGLDFGGETALTSSPTTVGYLNPWLPVGVNFHWKDLVSMTLFVLDLGQLLKTPILLGDESKAYTVNLLSVLTAGVSLGWRLGDSPVIWGLSIQYRSDNVTEANSPKPAGLSYGLGISVEVPMLFLHTE